jgi:hypothetical protein
MTKGLLILAFNILFGLITGFITSLVFRGDSVVVAGGKRRNIDRIKMVRFVTIAVILAGTFYCAVFPFQRSSWALYGMIFGNTVPVLVVFFMCLANKAGELIERPKPGITTATKAAFAREVYHSFKMAEFFVLSLFTLLYGYVFLLIPVFGLAWGYIMYNFLLLRN